MLHNSNKNLTMLNDFSKPKRLFPTGKEGIVLDLIFDSGFKVIDRYPPFTELIDETTKNFKRDYGYGQLLEFDGITERIRIAQPVNQHLDIISNQKYTFACRFRLISIVTSGVGDTCIFGRRQAGRFFGLQHTDTLIKCTLTDNLSNTYEVTIPIDLDWHLVYWGFDGSTWFIEFDGNRSENAMNSHGGFNVISNWGIGADGSLPFLWCNCQISEITLMVNNSL